MTNNENLTIQEKIINYLAINGIEQKELAKKLGISRVYLSEIKNGRTPSKVLLRRIEIFMEKN